MVESRKLSGGRKGPNCSKLILHDIYRAFERMRGKYESELILPGLGFTQRQLFWLSAARGWCRVQRPDTLRYMVSNNIYTYTRYQ